MITEPLDPLGVRGTSSKILRQSMLGQADVCLRRLDFDRRHGGGYSEARIFGTAYHAGLAAHYRHAAAIAQGENVDPFHSVHGEVRLALESELAAAKAAGCDIKWDRWGSEASALENAQKLADLYVREHAINLELFRVIGVEVPWWWPLGNGWIAHGTIDLIVEDKLDGTHWLHDHKTAGRPWKKGKEHARATPQPSWYLAFWPALYSAVMQTTPPVCRFAFDIMTVDGKFERRIADVKMGHIQATFEFASELTQLIDNGGPFLPNRSHFLCDERWCDHWNRCGFGGLLDVERPLHINEAS